MLRTAAADTYRAEHFAIALDQHGTKARDDWNSNESVGNAEKSGSIFREIAKRCAIAVQHRRAHGLRLRDLWCKRSSAVHAGERDEQAAFVHDGDGDPDSELGRLRVGAVYQLVCLMKIQRHPASFAE